MQNFLRKSVRLTRIMLQEDEYNLILPKSKYAPWRSDAAFNAIYKRIKKNTLVDKYRCYELWDLVEQTKDLRGGFLEVGVWRGGTAAVMGARALALGIDAPFYLADTFSGVVKAGERDTTYTGEEHSDTSQQIVEALLHEELKLPNITILKGIFPDDTAKLIPKDLRFRLCHIDVDVYNSAKEVEEWVWDRLVVGGVIVYDDYGFFTCDGITKFVNENKVRDDRVVIHNLNGHAIVIKIR